MSDTQAARKQRESERRVVSHVTGLLSDRAFVVPTTLGPKPAMAFSPIVVRWNQAAAVKQSLVAADRPDFELQDAMPIGEGLDASLGRQVLLAFRQPVAHVRFASMPPWDDLARGREPVPMGSDDVRRRVGQLPPPGDSKTPSDQFGGPMTLILFSGSGFTEEARQVARSFVDGPPTILIEPNDAGGFTLTGPAAAGRLIAMLDPEAPAERQARVAAALDKRKIDLLTGAVALDDLADQLNLPIGAVALATQQWAARSGEPLRVKPVNGVPMLFRDESLTGTSQGAGSQAASSGTLSTMDRLRRMLGANVSPEARLSELAEQRAALSRQRDRQYDEMATLEDRERELKASFAAEESTGARRRITSQLVQLGKDVDRRRQTVGVLNQQINVVGTHLHNLELARAGSVAGKLPTADELANDAARAEEVLADLQVTTEMADELAGGSTGATGLSDEEERLYAELTAESMKAKEAETPSFEREIPVTKQKAKDPAAGAFEVEAPVEDEPEAAPARRAEAN